MKLYYAPRTRAFTALWMAEEAGLPYERVRVELASGDLASAAYRAVNPMMKVPALEDGEAKVAETGAICAYLAEKAPSAGLMPPPGDPSRGRFWQWLFFAGNCIEPAIVQLATKLEMPTVQAAWGSAERVLDTLEEAVAPGPWILGEKFSAADVVNGAYLNYAVNIFKMVPSRPAFAAYIERCAARPAFKRAEEIANAA